MREYGDTDGDGYMDYESASGKGSGKPGLERLGRCHSQRGRQPGPASHRARGGAGIRLPRQADDGCPYRRTGDGKRADRLEKEAAEPEGALQQRLLAG